MVLTVRKFISLIVSIVLFNNQWSVAHWIGTSLVFGGAFIYGADSLFKSSQPPKSKSE
jgi:UDP-xylose/UDP-N-acetylglucosamine transporter B4